MFIYKRIPPYSCVPKRGIAPGLHSTFKRGGGGGGGVLLGGPFPHRDEGPFEQERTNGPSEGKLNRCCVWVRLSIQQPTVPLRPRDKFAYRFIPFDFELFVPANALVLHATLKYLWLFFFSGNHSRFFLSLIAQWRLFVGVDKETGNAHSSSHPIFLGVKKLDFLGPRPGQERISFLLSPGLLRLLS